MANVTVTLRPDYLARYVTLRPGRAVQPRRWEVQAGDANGFFTVAVQVDGEAPPLFMRKRDAAAYIAALGDVGRIWAQPRGRVPSAYVSPSQGGGFGVCEARA